MNLSHLPVVSDTLVNLLYKSEIPDISVIGLGLLNYLAIEGENLQSNASHLWFATGFLHQLRWTRKIRVPCMCHGQTKKFPLMI